MPDDLRCSDAAPAISAADARRLLFLRCSRPVSDDYELSPLGNPVAPDDLDPDRAAVYTAEDEWDALLAELIDDPAALLVVAAADRQGVLDAVVVGADQRAHVRQIGTPT